MSPQNKCVLHEFIDLLNYYWGMWARRSHSLQPLTKLTSKNINFNLTVVGKIHLMILNKYLPRPPINFSVF